MDKRVMKKTGENISLLGFGLMRLPHAEGDSTNIDYDKAKAMVDKAYKAGVNYFDTAYGYHGGSSQKFAAKALAEYPRDSYNLATKLPMWLLETPADAERIFDEQLKNCGVDYFDFYLFHGLSDTSWDKIEKLGLYEMMQNKRKEGKLRHLGFSFHGSPAGLQAICDTYKWDFAQIQMNYLDWEMQDAKAQYEILEKHDVPCIVMEPVRGGRLANLGDEANAMLKKSQPDKSIASWAMRWVAMPNVLCVLSGMTTMEQVDDNLKTYSPLEALSADQQHALEAAIEKFRTFTLVPCTACRYCMPCPADVHIPELIEVYNKCAFDSGQMGIQQAYAKFPAEHNASHCVACGQCEAACPQQIGVIDLMKKLAAVGADA